MITKRAPNAIASAPGRFAVTLTQAEKIYPHSRYTQVRLRIKDSTFALGTGQPVRDFVLFVRRYLAKTLICFRFFWRVVRPQKDIKSLVDMPGQKPRICSSNMFPPQHVVSKAVNGCGISHE